jgi:hypothetical protein
MKITCSLVIAVLLTFLVVPAARAADDGQTRPKLSSGGMSWAYGSSLVLDIVPLTSGSGNVKGFFCSSINGALWASSLQIYVDGGSAQTLNLADAPTLHDTDGMTFYTGWIPLNVRFGASIKVRLTRAGSSDQISCSVSWALD